MMKKCLLLCSLLVAWSASFQPLHAEDSAYSFVPEAGGLLDVNTGLVWSFDVTANAAPYGFYTFSGAVLACDDYSESAWSYGYDDWRVPTKAEFVDAFAKGMPAELDNQRRFRERWHCSAQRARSLGNCVRRDPATDAELPLFAPEGRRLLARGETPGIGPNPIRRQPRRGAGMRQRGFQPQVINTECKQDP